MGKSRFCCRNCGNLVGIMGTLSELWEPLISVGIMGKNGKCPVGIMGRNHRNCGNLVGIMGISSELWEPLIFVGIMGNNGKCPVGIMGKYPSELWKEIIGIVGKSRFCCRNCGNLVGIMGTSSEYTILFVFSYRDPNHDGVAPVSRWGDIFVVVFVDVIKNIGHCPVNLPRLSSLNSSNDQQQ
jgi:hypothetical protein